MRKGESPASAFPSFERKKRPSLGSSDVQPQLLSARSLDRRVGLELFVFAFNARGNVK